MSYLSLLCKLTFVLENSDLLIPISQQKLKAHLERHKKAAESEVVRVYQRSSTRRSRLLSPTREIEGVQVQPIVKRRKCVPLRDLQEAWETDSQSSVLALLC